MDYDKDEIMNLEELLTYIEENAKDVSDLSKIADIRRIEQGDPWRSKLIADVRQGYEAEAIEADLQSQHKGDVIPMTVKEKIRKLAADTNDQGYANACQIWKGHGDSGQEPYGWWLRPFNENERWIGSNLEEVKKLW
ncbi:hypothetical protein LCGC14_2978330 [marine sediment metagenome]|uniref:Uncharacterized protein n=1 Tax=marine sediment metagenome TaxID=412755 RepID=A0A0F8ZYI1_9ZZZZ